MSAAGTTCRSSGGVVLLAGCPYRGSSRRTLIAPLAPRSGGQGDGFAHPNPMGEWNHALIISRGRHVEHWLNGRKIVEYDRGSSAFRAAVAASKFRNIPGFDEWPDGHILLQEHGSEVSFKNIKIPQIHS